MSVAIEIECCIGHNSVPRGTHYHPNGENFIYSSGWNVGIGSLTSPQSQEFLKAHDGFVTCVSLSPSGNFVASGQRGENSDIFVWDFNSRKAFHRFEEHDFGILTLTFSHDEKMLASLGFEEDGKLIFWDLSNGCIIAASPKLPIGTNAVAFGGFVKDIKRRHTDIYQICTGGKEGILLWHLNPYDGELTSMKIVGDVRATINRQITSVTFSADGDNLYGSTSSGDFIIANMRAQRIVQTVFAAKKNVQSIVAYRDGVITGGGDGTVKVFSPTFEVINETTLDGSVIGLSVSSDLVEVQYSTICNIIFM